MGSNKLITMFEACPDGGAILNCRVARWNTVGGGLTTASCGSPLVQFRPGKEIINQMWFTNSFITESAVRDVFWLGPPAPKMLASDGNNRNDAKVLASDGKTHLESRCCIISIIKL